MARTKRFYKATEVEAMLQKAREMVGFVGDIEVNSIRTITETTKRNGRIGDKMLLVIEPKYIHIPKWQRKADFDKARKIGFSYNKYMWEVPKVILHDGKLYCVDGMHRILGAFVGGIEDVVVELLVDMTEKEAIELFLLQTTTRTAMKPGDYYTASLELEKPEYVTLRDICHRHNVQISGDDTLNNPIGTFSSITDGLTLAKSEPKLLDDILSLLCKLQWNGKIGASDSLDKCFGCRYVRTIRNLYRYYSNDTKAMEQILLTNCKGTEWFEKNVYGELQSRMFDKLSAIVQKGLAEQKKKKFEVVSA